MKELIKFIRREAKMSQEVFAASLGTTVPSINRWENDKAVPNKMAQIQLYRFCLEHEIDIAAEIIKSMEYEHDDDRLILYHGSKSGIVGDIAPSSRSECDFGQGFYMGTSTLQPLTLICGESKPVLYTVELDLSDLKVLELEVDMDWAMLIAYNRKEMEVAKGTRIYEKYSKMTKGYDVIVGYIANDRMYTELSRFFNRTLTDVALLNCLSALELGRQYVAITEKACSRIKIINERPLQPLELSALMDLSAARRREGIALTEEVEIKYRREGKYFDEILGGK